MDLKFIAMLKTFIRSSVPLLLGVAFFLCAEKGFGQEIPLFKWAKQTGKGIGYEYAWAVTTDASGNVLSTGEFTETADFDPGSAVFNLSPVSPTNRDIFISKLDANGNFLWAKSMGGGNLDAGLGITTDASGNVYITGYFLGSVDFDPGSGVFNLSNSNIDLFILKLNANGDFVWAKNFDPENGRSITYDPSGFIYVGATGASSNNRAAILKLDLNGNLVWSRILGAGGTSGVNSISINSLGEVIAIGSFNGTVDFDLGAGTFNLTSSATDLFIWKLDNAGNFVWVKQLDSGTPSFGNRSGSIDGSGNIYLMGNLVGTADFDPGAGSFNLTSSAGSVDIFVCKLDNDGKFVWAKRMGASGEERANCISVDPLGNVYTTGYFRNTVDFDPGAGIYSLTSAGNQEIFISKLDANGNFVWATRTGNTGTDEGYSVYADNIGNVYLTSFFYGTVDFDPTCTTFNLTSGGSTDVFIQKLSYTAAHSITSFTPVSGLVGSSVTITGTNFATPHSINTVRFNGAIAVVTSGSTTTLVATVPAGATSGAISVRIGCTTVNSLTNFTVTVPPVPTITSFTPSSGPIGTTVIITGANFSTTPTDNLVRFRALAIDGSNVLATVIASTSTSITVVVPDKAITGSISVTTSAGTANSSGNFTVTCGPAPSITSFAPTSGPVGTTVVITGTNFTTIPQDNLVSFNGYPSVVTASTATTITTTVPSGANGLGPIEVSVACNTVSSSSDFDVTCAPAPTITSFTPGTGAVGDLVTIIGTNFSLNPDDNFVYFNGEPAIVMASNTTSITTTVPANAFTGPIEIYVGCDFATSPVDFIVNCGPAPTITSFSPSNGLEGTTIVITGANFSITPTDNYVDFNGVPATVTASTSTSITTTVPTGATTGFVTIVVACNYGTSVTEFTVGNIITITAQPNDVTTCVNENATFSCEADGTTNISYQWEYSPNGSTLVFSDINDGATYSGATTNTLSVNTTGTIGEGRYRCRMNGDFATEITTNDKGLFFVTRPSAPITVSQSSCGPASITLNASGGTNGNYRWHTDAMSGTIPGEINSVYATPILLGTTTFYVSIDNGICESTRTPAIATINPIPPTPNANGASACTGSSAPLTASGGSNGQYRWYTTPTGGTAIAGETNSSYTTPILSVNTNYFVAINDGTCESTRTQVTATIITVAPPTTTGANACAGNTFTLTASGGTNGQSRWYTVATGGTAISNETNSTYTTPPLTASTNYYVSINNGTCESTRTPVTATIITAGCNPVITPTPLATQVDGKITIDLKPFITTVGILDVNSIKVIVQPTLSGATASIANGILTIDYAGKPFSGNETIRIEACNTLGACSQTDFEINVDGEIVVYNALSANGDILNATFLIQNIDALAETKTNRVVIFNRWGDVVFDVDNYDNTTKVFKGLSNDGKELPSGIYFYKVTFSSGAKELDGFISLKR
jgi:gliding motility-associated-like protein